MYNLNLSVYRRAKKRVARRKLGIWPVIGAEGKAAIYLMHRKIRTLQYLCDKWFNGNRWFIHEKNGFYYIKIFGPYLKVCLKAMENGDWKKL